MLCSLWMRRLVCSVLFGSLLGSAGVALAQEWPDLPQSNAAVFIPAQEWPSKPGPRIVRVLVHYPGGKLNDVSADTGLMLTLHNWGDTGNERHGILQGKVALTGGLCLGEEWVLGKNGGGRLSVATRSKVQRSYFDGYRRKTLIVQGFFALWLSSNTFFKFPRKISSFHRRNEWPSDSPGIIARIQV